MRGKTRDAEMMIDRHLLACEPPRAGKKRSLAVGLRPRNAKRRTTLRARKAMSAARHETHDHHGHPEQDQRHRHRQPRRFRPLHARAPWDRPRPVAIDNGEIGMAEPRKRRCGREIPRARAAAARVLRWKAGLLAANGAETGDCRSTAARIFIRSSQSLPEELARRSKPAAMTSVPRVLGRLGQQAEDISRENDRQHSTRNASSSVRRSTISALPKPCASRRRPERQPATGPAGSRRLIVASAPGPETRMAMLRWEISVAECSTPALARPPSGRPPLSSITSHSSGPSQSAERPLRRPDVFGAWEGQAERGGKSPQRLRLGPQRTAGRGGRRRQANGAEPPWKPASGGCGLRISPINQPLIRPPSLSKNTMSRHLDGNRPVGHRHIKRLAHAARVPPATSARAIDRPQFSDQ